MEENDVHIAVDWAGDPGFKKTVKGGSLPYCAMAIVVSETADEIEAALRDVRLTRRLRKDYEFKYTKAYPAVKDAFMEAVAKTSFTAIVVIYHKDAMDPPWAWGKNDDLLAQLLMRGLLHLPRTAIENAKMMIDGDAEAKKLRTMVRPMLSHDAEARGLDYRIAGISTGDSRQHAPLQLADMVGGAAVETWERGMRLTPGLRKVRHRVTIDVITPDMKKPAT